MHGTCFQKSACMVRVFREFGYVVPVPKSSITKNRLFTVFSMTNLDLNRF